MNIRVLGTDDWPIWRKLRLDALREAPYAFSSKLADWQGIGDTEVRWRNRLETVPYNLVAELNGTLAGMVSATAPNQEKTIELISMWVAPFARGYGVGDLLVASVVEWAQHQRAATITLDVVEGNEHAFALYRRHGFVDSGAVSCNGCGGLGKRKMVRGGPAANRDPAFVN